jgi:hypothetical protein
LPIRNALSGFDCHAHETVRGTTVTRRSAAIFVVTTLALLALITASATLGAGPALAGQGGKGGDTSTTTAWVSASPNPALAYSRVELDGCGFEVKPVQLRIVHSAGYTETYGAGVWSPGCIDTYFSTAEAGTYTIEVWQSTGNKRRSTLTLKASTVLTVTQ